jgi:hypothetical protein
MSYVVILMSFQTIYSINYGSINHNIRTTDDSQIYIQYYFELLFTELLTFSLLSYKLRAYIDLGIMLI